MNPSAAELYAEAYDALGVGWPGAIDFYRDLALAAASRGERVLDVACGTGRVAIALAEQGVAITGLDRSPEMLAVARRKSRHLTGVRWVEADMRSFDLGERFGLAIVPAHSFQFMLTAGDQMACLEAIQRHLAPEGTLVIHLDHQNLDWLGGLPATGDGSAEHAPDVIHPQTGRLLRRSLAWNYKRATQTATVTVLWEELDAGGTAIDRVLQEPIPLHCVFRFEMEHLLARAGTRIEAVYGDFLRRPLENGSAEMIWVARAGA